jgi:hypothetical protein
VPRQVDCRVFLDVLRDARKGATASEHDDAFAQGVWCLGPCPLPGYVPREGFTSAAGAGLGVQDRRRALRSKTSLLPCFLSLFSGSEHAAQAAAVNGHDTLCYDIVNGSLYDLTKPSVLNGIIVLLYFDAVDYIGLDMCCQSWSRARRWDGGPVPLRDDDPYELWGRFGLSSSDVKKVLLGNRLLHITAFIAYVAYICDVPGYIENPFSSRCWLTSVLKQLSEGIDAVDKQVHYCQYGMRWKKPTRFLCWLIRNDDWNPRLCCSSFSGKCSRTGQPHVQLSGKSNGVYKTLQAQPYPLQLCKEVISVFSKAINR